MSAGFKIKLFKVTCDKRDFDKVVNILDQVNEELKKYSVLEEEKQLAEKVKQDLILNKKEQSVKKEEKSDVVQKIPLKEKIESTN